MPNRSYTAGSQFRYGFNGKENDNDVKGVGAEQDYGERIYDTRIGRFLSLDPLSDEYPELTPYQFASNRPIDGVDLDGLEFSKAELISYLEMAQTKLKAAAQNNSIAARGISNAIVNANTLGFTDQLGSWGTDNASDYDYSDYDKTTYLWGRVAGDALAALQGLTEMTAGTGTASTGAAVSSSGVGAIVGGPLALTGLLVAGHGAGTTAAAALDLGETINQLKQMGAFSTGASDAQESTKPSPEQNTNKQTSSAHSENKTSKETSKASPSTKKTVKQKYKELTEKTRKDFGGNVTVQRNGKDLFRVHDVKSGHGTKVTTIEKSQRTYGNPSSKDVPVRKSHIRKIEKGINKEGGYSLRTKSGKTN